MCRIDRLGVAPEHRPLRDRSEFAEGIGDARPIRVATRRRFDDRTAFAAIDRRPRLECATSRLPLLQVLAEARRLSLAFIWGREQGTRATSSFGSIVAGLPSCKVETEGSARAVARHEAGMRIWHLLMAVLATAFALLLLRRVPAVGMLVLLDSGFVVCAILQVRYERRVQALWSHATRCGGQPPGRPIVFASAAVVVYQAITPLILGMAVLSVAVTLLVILASGVAALSNGL